MGNFKGKISNSLLSKGCKELIVVLTGFPEKIKGFYRQVELVGDEKVAE